MTLFIVTLVSILTILPWAIYASIPEEIKEKWRDFHEVHKVLGVIYFANSVIFRLAQPQVEPWTSLF